MRTISKTGLADFISTNQYRYYYTTLSEEMKGAYAVLLEGYMKQLNRIEIHVSNIDEAWEVHSAVCYDIPELFFIKSVKGSYNPPLSSVTICPEYRFDYETCCNILKRMQEKTFSFIRRISMLSEQDKIRQIHDYIVRNVTYKDLKAPYSHESPGVLVYGIAVCEGIAKAFKYLADRVGISSIVVTGNAIDFTNHQRESEGHAWNIVLVDSCPYHLDVTFDYSLSTAGAIRYDYYLLSDLQIETDHSFDGTPPCINNYEFYQINGCFVNSKKMLQSLVREELKPGKPLVVKTPDFQVKAEDVAKEILAAVSAAIPIPYAFQSSVVLSYNNSRMIFQIELVRSNSF